MSTNNFSPFVIGWMSIVTGVIAILAVIFLILMSTVNMSFGKVNDVFNGLIGISSLILAWMLYAEHYAKSPLMSQIALLCVVVGMIFTIIGSVLIIYGYTGFVLAGFYTALGNAFIGLWLALFCYAMQNGDVFPRNLVTIGLIVSAFLALGLICIQGIFAGTDSMNSLPWYLYLGLSSFLGTYILYPIWAIWLGRILLSKQ